MTSLVKRRPPWTKHVHRDPSLPVLTAGVAIPLAVILAVIVLMLRPANGALWFCAGVALGTPPLVLLARRMPGAAMRPYVGKTVTRYALTLDEAERRILAHLAASGGTAGMTPEHGGVPRAPYHDVVLGLTLDGHAFLAELAWWRGRLVACVGPAPEPLTPGYDRFMTGLDLVLAAPPQRGFPTLPPLSEEAEEPGAVTVERRRKLYRMRVPKLLYWLVMLLFLLWISSVPLFGILAHPTVVGVLALLAMLVVVSIGAFIAIMAAFVHVEALVHAWLRLEGPRVTYGWTGGRPREVTLDENALVDVHVQEGFAGRAASLRSVVGYSFKGGRRTIMLHENMGFDRDDLVRMWPAVLDAARRQRTMVGAEMFSIAAGVDDDIREPRTG